MEHELDKLRAQYGPSLSPPYVVALASHSDSASPVDRRTGQGGGSRLRPSLGSNDGHPMHITHASPLDEFTSHKEDDVLPDSNTSLIATRKTPEAANATTWANSPPWPMLQGSQQQRGPGLTPFLEHLSGDQQQNQSTALAVPLGTPMARTLENVEISAEKINGCVSMWVFHATFSISTAMYCFP